ncbi:hypothetical protein [Kitasatospora griseola]|uniref:hypothetical protein n=1 Tax=Kitasatospora griseola TaxID=2064 RepID=UPI0034242B85
MRTPDLIAIDPWDCGCTECIIGEYVPLAQATPEQILRMLRGELRNHTSTEFTVQVKWTLPDDFRRTDVRMDSVEVSASIGDRVETWDVGPLLPTYGTQPVFGEVVKAL